MANITDLIQRARTIRVETKSKKNTADRIGGLLLDIVNGLDEAQSLKKALYGGIVATSTDVVSDYAAKDYSGPYFYLVGSSLSSLVVYQYAGTGSPAQAFGGAAYDFSDYSEALSRIDALVPKISEEIDGVLGEVLLLKKINSNGEVGDASGSSNRTLAADVSGYVGEKLTIGGRLYAKSGSNTYCWWTILDANGDVLDHSDTTTGSESITYDNVKLTIPAGAKMLYVQGSANTKEPYARATSLGDIKQTIKNHDNDLKTIHDEISISGDNIVGNPDASLNRFISASTGNWSNEVSFVGSIACRVVSGETYIIQANENKIARYYLLTSIDTSASPSYMTGAEATTIPAGESATVTIPENGYLLILREYYSTGSGDYLPTSVAKNEAVKEVFAAMRGNVNEISYVQIRHSVVGLKKINSDGSVTAAAAGASNRTFIADVSDIVGNTLFLDGTLYKYVASDNLSYCWWVFHDGEGNVVEKSNTSETDTQYYSNVPVVVPDGAVTLYVQGGVSNMPKAKDLISNVVTTLVDDDNSVANGKSARKFALDYPCLNGTTGKITTGGTATNKFCKHTPEYIKVHNSIKIKNLGTITQNVSVYFYDKDLGFISYTTYPAPVGTDEVEVTDIPDGAVWFRISFYAADNNVASIVGYPRFEVDIESEWGYGSETTQEPYIEYLPFIYSVKVNIPIRIAEHSYTTKTVFAYDEGLIHLPPAYTHNGKPTPVIFFIHGDAERYTIGESTFSGHMKMQQCWSDAGFAQVDLDLIPSCYNEPTLAATGGTRDDLECLSAAWEWITNHFNVDKRGFYLIGRSRGGQCVLEILGKGGAVKLPIIAAISMAGANSMFEYSVFSTATEREWNMWCNAHGLPTTGRPSWAASPVYAGNKSFLTDEDCYNFVVNNWNLWWRKALTGWGLITKNTEGITPKNYFDNFIYPYVQAGRSVTDTIEAFFVRMRNTMEAKSPIPLRLDWCVGDQTQNKEYFKSDDDPMYYHSYSTVFAEILLSTPASLVEYRRWPGVDVSNPYEETDPHYAENMIFYDGDLTLPNGAVTHNPSKVTMEWLIWCMGKDPRYQGLDYTLPWQ